MLKFFAQKEAMSARGVTISVKGRRYTYYKSTRAGKKLMTTVDGRVVHFGALGYEHYRDRTGLYRSLDHGDPARRASYIARHRGGDGAAISDPTKPAFHALNVLW